MDDLTEPRESNRNAGEPPKTQREWELAERVAELEARIEEKSRAEAIREVEILSLRHELELRLAYNGHLEQLASERQHQIDWFRMHAGPIASVAGLDDDDVRTQLLAERQRISYRVVQRLSRYAELFNVARRIGRKIARQ